MHPQLPALDRPPQIGFQLQAGHHEAVHDAVEHHVAGAPRGLGPVHGGVGVAQQILRPLVLRRVDGDADRGGDEDLVAAEIDGGRQAVVDALGHAHGVADVAPAFEQDGELVAAHPGDGVRGA